MNLQDSQQKVLGYMNLMKDEPLIRRSKQTFPFIKVSLATVEEALQSQVH